MAAVVSIIVKLMPDAPNADLKAIEAAATASLEPEGAKNISFEEKPIAFGLKALMIKIDMPEEKGTDLVEQKLSALPEVSSVTIEDYRRAFG